MNLQENYTGSLTNALNVLDISKSITWYEEILGFKLLYYKEDLGWAELAHPTNSQLNIGLSQVEKMPPPGGNSVAVWGVKDIEKAYEDLKQKDVRFDGEISTIENMVRLATFYDLDGNCFMFYQDLA